MVWPRFAHWLLTGPDRGVIQLAKTDTSKNAISDVAALYSRWISGEKPSKNELHSAAYAATAAAAAADAAYASYTDAAYAAAAYADAAYAAAGYAADAAERLVGWLSGLIDEYDRLSGRTSHREVTSDDLRVLAEAVAR